MPERIPGKQAAPGPGKVEPYAAPIAFRAMPRDQAATFKRLDDLRRRPARRCLKTGEGRGRACAGIGAGKEAQAGPLRHRQIGVRVLGSANTPKMDEQFRDAVYGVESVCHMILISKRNQFDKMVRCHLISIRNEMGPYDEQAFTELGDTTAPQAQP